MTSPPVEIVTVRGTAEGVFAPFADVFGRLVAAQGHGGAALSIYHHGRPVVDLVGGDYPDDALQLIFSVSKAVTAITLAGLHDDGILDLDAPLGDVWPAFRKPSTAAITPRMVLAHRSGLPAVAARLTVDDLRSGEDEEAVARQEPYWEPGSAHGYHAFTFGSLLQGWSRRATGHTVGSHVARRLAGPLGLDLHLGLSGEKAATILPRVRRIVYEPPRMTSGRAVFVGEAGIPAGTSAQLQGETDFYNSPELMRLGVPSTSGIAGARDLARLFAATLGPVDGVRVLGATARDAMIAPLSSGLDRVLGVPTAFGSGVQLPFPQFPLLSRSSYGHEAAGGSAAFADVAADVAVGFTTDVFPSTAGASSGFLALLPVLAHCLRDAA